jgi:Zn-dependent protease
LIDLKTEIVKNFRRLEMFLEYLTTDPLYYMSWILIIIFSVSVHEFSHALSAYLEGDNTAKNLGYFTLDPIKHMGWASLGMLLFLGLAWGSCPVNPHRFKHKALGDAIVSFAGPLANGLLAILFSILYVISVNFLPRDIYPNYIMQFIDSLFYIGVYANIALLLLNLIPLPPLDGHRVFSYLVPSIQNFYNYIGNSGFLFLFILLWLPGVSSVFWNTSVGISDFLIGFFSLFVN